MHPLVRKLAENGERSASRPVSRVLYGDGLEPAA